MNIVRMVTVEMNKITLMRYSVANAPHFNMGWRCE